MEKIKSYGTIGINRVNSTGKFLLDSDTPHNSYVSITISTGELEEERHYNRVFPKDQIIRVAMTNVQFANLITSLNTSPTPCTLERLKGHEIEEYSPHKSATDIVFRKGKTYLENASTKGLLNRVKEIIENSKLNKKAKKEIEVSLRNLDNSLKANAAFYLEQFINEAEKVTVDAKSEIEAVKQNLINELGQEALKKLK